MKTMKFTAAHLLNLTPGLAPFPGAIEEVAATVMTIQGSPQPGRVNVSFVREGRTQFRTYSTAILESM